MCEQCQARYYPCSCVEAQPDVKCPLCGDAITESEKRYIINGERYHLDCLRCMDTTDLMELLGFEAQTGLGVAGE